MAVAATHAEKILTGAHDAPDKNHLPTVFSEGLKGQSSGGGIHNFTSQALALYMPTTSKSSHKGVGGGVGIDGLCVPVDIE
jgi:hypothetical protein